jgi:hypothetical protein
MFGSLMMFASGVFARRAKLREVVRLPPIGRQAIGKRRENPARERDVLRRDGDARRPRERLDDREQRIRRECRCFVGVCVDDVCCAHVNVPIVEEGTGSRFAAQGSDVPVAGSDSLCHVQLVPCSSFAVVLRFRSFGVTGITS